MAANGGTSGCGTTGVMFGVAFVVGSRSAGNDSGSGSGSTSHDGRIVMLGCIKAFFWFIENVFMQVLLSA